MSMVVSKKILGPGFLVPRFSVLGPGSWSGVFILGYAIINSQNILFEAHIHKVEMQI